MQNIVRVCFTGPRIITPYQSNLLVSYAKNYIIALSSVYDKCEFSVGDADGVDKAIRNLLISLRLPFTLFQVEDKTNKASYARRSISMVNSCVPKGINEQGMIFGFPNKECPSQIKLNNPFCGSGSGTWATIAYAKSKSLKTNLLPLTFKINTDIKSIFA